jgi:sec-independent protein translocase protein TatC
MNQSAFQQVIKEAQVRLGWSVFGFLFSLSVGYYYSEEFVFFFALPIRMTSVITEFLCTQMTEAFRTYLKVSFVVSFYVNAPLFIYHIWCFFIPSCTKQQTQSATRWLILSAILFCAGFLFAYWFVVPMIWTFFVNQCNPSISLLHFELQPRIYDYILLLFRIMLVFGLCSQVPLLVAWFIKQRAQKIAPRFQDHKLLFYRKKILFLSICVAALVSPPDVWSQLILLLPTYLFIEIVIFYEILLGEYNLVG